MLNVFRSMTNDELADEHRSLRAEMRKLERRGHSKNAVERKRLAEIRKYLKLIQIALKERYIQKELF